MDRTAGSASSKCRVALQELSTLDRSLCWPLVLVSIVFSLEYSQPLRRSLLSYCTYSQDTILPVCQCDIAEGSWPNCRLSLFRSLPVQWKMASVVVIAVIVISSLGGALFQSKLCCFLLLRIAWAHKFNTRLGNTEKLVSSKQMKTANKPCIEHCSIPYGSLSLPPSCLRWREQLAWPSGQ